MTMSVKCFESGAELFDALNEYDQSGYSKLDIEQVLEAVYKLFVFSAKHDTPNLHSIQEFEDHALKKMQEMAEVYWPGSSEMDMGLKETAIIQASRTYHIVSAWIKAQR